MSLFTKRLVFTAAMLLSSCAGPSPAYAVPLLPEDKRGCVSPAPGILLGQYYSRVLLHKMNFPPPVRALTYKILVVREYDTARLYLRDKGGCYFADFSLPWAVVAPFVGEQA